MAKASLVASLLGSLLGTIALLGWAALEHGAGSSLVNQISAFLLVWLVGTVIGVAIGCAVGLPLLLGFGQWIAKHPIVGTLLLGLIGVGLGSIMSDAQISPAPELFGGIIGALHPIIWVARNGQFRKALAVAGGSVIAIPVILWISEDAVNLHSSRAEFDRLCDDGNGMIEELDYQTGLARKRRGWYEGDWFQARPDRSLYKQVVWVKQDERTILEVTDFVFAPEGVLAELSGGRRMARHCGSEAGSGETRLLQSLGLGEKPELSELRF